MARETALATLSRMKILTILKNNPMTINQIVKEAGLSRTNVYHHLETLKRNGLIYEKKFGDKQGQPVLITTNYAKPLSRELISLGEKIVGMEKRFKEKK
jgi:DNA-binding transcriptional ArsR family regulator